MKNTPAGFRIGLDAMPEEQLTKAVIDLAHAYGWTVAHFRPARTEDGWRTAVSGDGAGFPDLVLAHPTRGILFVELKSAAGVLTFDQRRWIALLGKHARTEVWRPEGLIAPDGMIVRALSGR